MKILSVTENYPRAIPEARGKYRNASGDDFYKKLTAMRERIKIQEEEERKEYLAALPRRREWDPNIGDFREYD